MENYAENVAIEWLQTHAESIYLIMQTQWQRLCLEHLNTSSVDTGSLDCARRAFSEMTICTACKRIDFPAGYRPIWGHVELVQYPGLLVPHMYGTNDQGSVICLTPGQFVGEHLLNSPNGLSRPGDRIAILKALAPELIFEVGEVSMLHGLVSEINAKLGLEYK